jgi:hypothetical protein
MLALRNVILKLLTNLFGSFFSVRVGANLEIAFANGQLFTDTKFVAVNGFSLFVEQIKEFFLLFHKYISFNVFVLTACACISLYVKFGHANLLLVSCLSMVAFISAATLDMRRYKHFTYSCFVQPLVFYKKQVRFMFYWNILAATLAVTGVALKFFVANSFIDIGRAFFTGHLFLSTLLIMRNLVLTILYGWKRMELDWTFTFLFYFCLRLFFLGFECVGDFSFLYKTNILVLNATFAVYGRAALQKASEGFGLNIGKGIATTVLVMTVGTQVYDAGQTMYNAGYQAALRDVASGSVPTPPSGAPTIGPSAKKSFLI